MPEYTIYLRGLTARDHGLPGRVLRHLLDALDEGARGAVRLRLEGRSTAPGSPPGWLEEASAFDLIGFAPEAPGVRLRAPTLREALPDRFDQGDLFPLVDPDSSAIGLLSESLSDALRGREDSEAYDRALLKTLTTLDTLFKRGVESIEIRNQKRQSAVDVAPPALERVRRLYRSTPSPRRVRLAGWIDAIRYSDRAFTILLETGRMLRGVLTEGPPETLATFFGRPAIVSGLAHFRPSGAVQRVEAERLHPTTPHEMTAWSVEPRPLDTGPDHRNLRRPQTRRTGIGAVFGRWPGDESDEEIFRILEETS